MVVRGSRCSSCIAIAKAVVVELEHPHRDKQDEDRHLQQQHSHTGRQTHNHHTPASSSDEEAGDAPPMTKMQGAHGQVHTWRGDGCKPHGGARRELGGSEA